MIDSFVASLHQLSLFCFVVKWTVKISRLSLLCYQSAKYML